MNTHLICQNTIAGITSTTPIADLTDQALIQLFRWAEGDAFARSKGWAAETDSPDPQADADAYILEMAKRLVDRLEHQEHLRAPISSWSRTDVYNVFRKEAR